jgi:hypothetical protein
MRKHMRHNFCCLLLSILTLSACQSIAGAATAIPTQIQNTPVPTTTMTVFTDLSGFQSSGNVTEAEGVTLYSYIPIDTNDYGVTMGVSKKDLDTHSESYPLEKSSIVINGLSVKIGFQEDFVYNDVRVSTAYESLAFDFKYKDQFFSGEITNFAGEPAKARLLEILETLVIAITNV